MNRCIILLLGFLAASNCAQATEELQAPVFQYAQNIEVAHLPTHRLITIRNINRNSQDTFHYALVPKSNTAPLPELPKGTLIVRTPVKRVVIMTTTFIGFIDALNLHDTIIGVATPKFINNPLIHKRLDAGSIQSVQTGPSLDIESMLLLQPDLIFTSSSGNPAFDVHPKLARSGLPVVLTAGYMEQNPLARSEWIKFIAAFFEADALAQEIFSEISTNYQTLLEKTRSLTDRPTVFSGAPYSGAWHVPGGKSYVAQAIHDAGGDYIWKADKTAGGIPLDFERVFLKAARADIWINPGSYKNMPQLLGADQRFGKFNAAQASAIYNNSKQTNSAGGNNIWERGIVHPEEVLADLIKIFQPRLMDDHTFIYYEALK